ncbi:MAG: leucine-rich repeat domain-containing protein [Christensenellaceae bacterium]|jgi:hypothetical protein|nr:leucine-rich repeat domain-containing protein [Christensenellaceae bacterium]
MIKKSFYIILIIVLTGGIGLLSFTSTLAAWAPSETTEQITSPEVPDRNDSLRYIVFMALDDKGAVISNEDQIETQLASFAAVGYTGLIDEIEFPNTYEITTKSGSSVSKPVSAILVLSRADYSKIPLYMDGKIYADKEPAYFDGNYFIVRVLIAASITRIASTAFAGCVGLKTLEFEASDNSISIGDHAFSNCMNLANVIDNDREIIGDDSFIVP